jgi:2-keto-4-pentenoate hydratase/2-oxohepta-3-ene-1,7-dioic acid hydratase in catechol pathway
MRLVTYRPLRAASRIGAVVTPDAGSGVVLDLAALAADLAKERGSVRRGRGGFAKSIVELIQRGAAAMTAAREALEHGLALVHREGVAGVVARRLAAPLERAGLEAPIPRPSRNVFCLGRNYAEHAAERGADVPAHPVYFTKPPESVLAPGGSIVHHATTKELDYEVELAVVIGVRGRDIPRGRGLEHVFGYTIINDVTARDLQKRHGQWFKGKSMDTFCPMGPMLVTPDEIGDPQALAITLRVNGETRQKSHTGKMIFSVDECIEVLSIGMTLYPGDIIATGTPDGVGAASGRFLNVGDTVEAEVERIGVLTNTVIAP